AGGGGRPGSARPEGQNARFRAWGVWGGTPWPPPASGVPPGPPSSTTPAPSWPRTAGKSPDGSRPLIVYASVWHTPVAASRTRHSPARGPSRSTTSTSSGRPGSQQTAASTFMAGAISRRALPRSACRTPEPVLEAASNHDRVRGPRLGPLARQGPAEAPPLRPPRHDRGQPARAAHRRARGRARGPWPPLPAVLLDLRRLVHARRRRRHRP